MPRDKPRMTVLVHAAAPALAGLSHDTLTHTHTHTHCTHARTHAQGRDTVAIAAVAAAAAVAVLSQADMQGHSWNVEYVA